MKTSRSQELASPQSLPPTPKRRSRRRESENANPNAFPGIPEEPSSSQGKWHASHQTAANHLWGSTREDPGLSEEAQRVKAHQKHIAEGVDSKVSSTAAFDVFSPADWKQQSSRVPAPAPAQLQGLRKGPLLPLEEEPSLEAAVQQDRRVPASSRPAADAPSLEASKEQSWEDRIWEEIAHLPHGGAEGAAGNTAAWLPHVPKHSSISLQALAPAGQVNSRTQDRGASRGRSTTADKATPAAEAAQTAREYKPPAEKPKPLRTGLEAATYPCYIEILQKARLRPERPPGVPPRRRPVQPTAARPAAAAATQKTDKAVGKGVQNLHLAPCRASPSKSSQSCTKKALQLLVMLKWCTFVCSLTAQSVAAAGAIGALCSAGSFTAGAGAETGPGAAAAAHRAALSREGPRRGPGGL